MTRPIARVNGECLHRKCVVNPPSTMRPKATTRGSRAAVSMTTDRSIILRCPLHSHHLGRVPHLGIVQVLRGRHAEDAWAPSPVLLALDAARSLPVLSAARAQRLFLAAR